MSKKTAIGIVLLVLGLRAILLSWTWYIHPADQAAHETFLQIWKRWDGEHYLEIAGAGYEGKGVAADRREFNSRFPPLYPLLIRYSSAVLPLADYVCGILISLLSLIGASLLLLLLVEQETGNRRAGWWAVAFLNIHPGSYFAHAVYAESLFLFFSLLYFFGVRIKGSPWIESLSISGLILTRQAGLAFLPLHFIQTAKRLRHECRINPKPLLASVKQLTIAGIPLLGYAAFLLLQYQLKLPGYSGQHVPFVPRMPFAETAEALLRFTNWQDAWSDEFFLYTLGYSHLILAVTVLLVFAGMFLLPYEYSVAGLGYIVLLGTIRWNIGSIRYTFGLATVPIILVKVCPEWLRWIVAAVFSFLLGYFAWLFVVKYQLI